MELLLLNKYQVSFNAKQRRIRCVGHIINLSLQAFLLASSKEAIQAALLASSEVSGEELISHFSNTLSESTRDTQSTSQRQRRDSQDSISSTLEEFSGIQGLSSLRKLHELCIWLRSSSLHANIWDDTVGLRLGIDNRTRWSSWYMVIDRVMLKQAKIKAFMTDHEEQLGHIRFSAQDWDLLSKAHTFLQPFASATLYAEGDKSSISQSLLLMDALLTHYERNKAYYSQEDYYDIRMIRAIDMGWYILDKYYNITSEVPAYIAALLLDPSRRIAYIQKNWPNSWILPAIQAATALWEENFKLITVEKNTPTSELISIERPSRKRGSELDLLMKDMEVIPEDIRDDDDFIVFTKAAPFRIDCTPLEWWCRTEQKSRYPRLHLMAIAILSIPAESAEPERIFSGSRRTCSWDRLKLSCQNIERIECIGSWIREGHIRLSKDNGMGLPMDEITTIDDEFTDDILLDDLQWV